MKFFDAGQEATGVIAIGQVATGVIAIGQMATGVIAIGQLARGIVVVGQGAVGFFAVGMGALGLVKATAMVGIAGRRGWGGVLPLIPTLGKPRTPPKTISFAEVQRGGSGWVCVEMEQDRSGTLVIRENGRALPVKLHRRLITGMRKGLGEAPEKIFVMMSKHVNTYVGERVMIIPRAAFKRPGFWGIAAVQFAGLVMLSAAIWLIVLYPLNDALIKIFL
jgi:hypothetical protein